VPAHIIVGIGELLWDVLPGGKQIGGAPANLAYISGLLGDWGVIASRIGADDLGDEIRKKLISLGVDTSYLQVDHTYPTGTVNVRVDPDGQPIFDIAAPVAWDFIDFTRDWESLARRADAVYFGTLGQRYPHSVATTKAFIAAVRRGALKVFDANLRQSFFSPEVIAESLELANMMKLNHDELPRVAEMLGLTYDGEKSSAERLRRAYGLKLVCVTRGERGSLIVTEDGADEHPGFPVRVVDTVGAGDAFTATLIHHFLQGSSPTASLSAINDAANRMGSWVASHAGGTPPVDAAQLDKVRASEGS
jgi:fructokinase